MIHDGCHLLLRYKHISHLLNQLLSLYDLHSTGVEPMIWVAPSIPSTMCVCKIFVEYIFICFVTDNFKLCWLLIRLHLKNDHGPLSAITIVAKFYIKENMSKSAILKSKLYNFQIIVIAETRLSTTSLVDYYVNCNSVAWQPSRTKLYES